MKARGFGAVKASIVGPSSGRSRYSAQEICDAVNKACLVYLRQPRCLMKAAVTTVLLRRHGFAATMVLGVSSLPVGGHAWVELGGDVLNELDFDGRKYSIMDRI